MRSLIGTAKQLLLPLSVLMLCATVAVLAGCNDGSDTSDVHALFNLETPSGGPFPTDVLTVQDASQLTERRVNLPAPDCAVRRSDCEDLGVINTLDGFHVQPRLSIPFDGLIDVTTVTRETVFLVRLGSTSCDGDEGCDEAEDDGSRVIGINQVVWDPETHTLHAESDALLDQHTRYALIVTRGVRDQFGQPVGATEAFRQFRQHVRGEYQLALLDAMRAAGRVGVPERDMVTASVFTTQSTTAILEKIRNQIKAATPEAATFRLGPGGTRTVFRLDTVAGLTSSRQTGDDPPTFTPFTPDVSLLQSIPGAVGAIAFGKYTAPDYEVHPGEFIPPIGTRSGTPAVHGTHEMYFNLVLPSGPQPTAGWPVAIFGHGSGGNKNNSLNVAATMAAHGIATIAINAVGAGFGRLSTLTVTQTGSAPVTFSAGGRGIDQNGDHMIEAGEGFGTAPPRTILFCTDGFRQTVADLMQLVRVIERGMDVDGDGVPDLDPARISSFGWSLGGNYGTVFLGVEPSVQAGVLICPGGPTIENRRLSPAVRPVLGQLLAARLPPLLNAPGITSLAGIPIGPPRFHEHCPLRDGIPLQVRLADGTRHDIQSPISTPVAGAIAIQEVVERTKWVSRSGDAVAYAPHLRKHPLVGMPVKAVLYQFAWGDQDLPNPNTTALLRAGDVADRATFYRHDLAFAENPALPKGPHSFIISINIAAFRAIALGAQEQIATFFASHGEVIIHPEPRRFFEVPIVLPLPEDLNVIP